MKFILDKDTLTIEENKFYNSGSVDYYEAEIQFDETWNDLTIEAIITKMGENKGISRSPINNKLMLDIQEFGTYTIGFVGYKIENEEKIYQISTDLGVIQYNQGAGEIETENEPIITPTEWEIYIAQIQEMLDDVPTIPTGGTTGQVLAKKSNTDGDVEWVDQQGGGGSSDHSQLNNLDYEHSGHTGFQRAGNYVEDENYVHTDNNYTTNEKNKLAGLSNYDDTEVKQDIADLDTNKADKSEIPDVSNFITKSVNDLVNYYLKTDTYTKTEVNNLISAIEKATFEVVNQLPATGVSNVIYLVPSSNPKAQNVKDEYIWINNAWEQIGSTQVDLTGYATETWVNTQISGFLTQSQIETLINTAVSGKYTKPNTGIPKTDLATDIQTSLGKADTALQSHQDISGKANKISVVQTSASTIEINPNTFYKFGEVASLTITLASITDNTIYNEYMFEFVSGTTATTLTLPSSIKWLETPTIDANKIYQCSIVDNVGLLVGVANV